MELITDPTLIFLDEPTTGLDSFTATSVMETLGDLARKDNRTVVSTIHQPNSDIFEMFDRLMLLARGKIIYFNKSSLSVNYFSSIGYKCPELSNPCDFFMSMMSKESIEQEEEEQEAVVDNETIDQKYEQMIALFDRSYQDSALKNDHSIQHPECHELDKGSFGARTSFCY